MNIISKRLTSPGFISHMYIFYVILIHTMCLKQNPSSSLHIYVRRDFHLSGMCVFCVYVKALQGFLGFMSFYWNENINLRFRKEMIRGD